MNSLNQTASRGVPGYVSVVGLANASASVSVNNRVHSILRSGSSSASSSNPTLNVFQPYITECYTYDLDGNLTADARWTYAWDSENPLGACPKNGIGPAARARGSRRRGMTAEPTKPSRKRPAARWVSTGRVAWLRCSSVTDPSRVCSLVSPRHPAPPLKTGPIRFFGNALSRMEPISGIPDATKLKLEFGYDATGRRIQKKSYSWLSGAWSLGSDIRFAYDGWSVLAELDSSLNPVRTYLWGLDLSGSLQGAGGVGGLISVRHHGSGGAAYLALFDGNGNVTGLVTASTGAPAATYEYGPYGEPIRRQGDHVNLAPFRWSTKYTDDEPNLVYYGYRFYNSTTGRWLSHDSIRERGGVSLYGFVDNATIIFIDPLGQVSWMQLLRGGLQAASGVMMWVAAVPTEVGTAGIATPVAVGLGFWGAFSIANGINTIAAAVQDKGSPEALQVQIVTSTYQAVTGYQMSPTDLMITRGAYYATDIATCAYSIRASWTTASENSFVVRTYNTEKYVTPSMIEVQKVPSHLKFSWRLHHAPRAGSIADDYYGLWTDLYDWTGTIIEPPGPPPLIFSPEPPQPPRR